MIPPKSLPFKQELYTVAARQPTQEELDSLFWVIEADVRVWFEDPCGWTLPEFIGFHLGKAITTYQLSPEQCQWLRDHFREEYP